MNRRRFGSTILLSSLAALAVVGTGLAVASWLPAEGESQFGIHFNDNTSKVIGEVTTTTKDARFDITWDSASGTAGFDKDIVFRFTPDESLDLTGKELELSWTATFPEGFDTYFDVTTSGVLSPDATTRAATYSFTLEKDALKASLKDGQDYAAAHEAIGDEAQLTLSYKVDLKETAEPEPVVESVTLDAESLSFKVSDEAKTLKATVKMTTGDAPAIAWTFSEGYETYIDVTGEDTDTLSITPKAAGEVTITATAGGKSDSAKVTITEESVEPSYSISQINEAGATYTVRGVVDAVTMQGIVVTDGTDSVYVYLKEAPSNKIGDYVEITGKASSYNKMLQFSSPEIKAVEDGEPITPATPVALTKEIADSWSTKESFATSEMKEYTWTTTAGLSGKFTTLNFEGSDTVIEPAYMPADFVVETGKNYVVTAYFGGYFDGFSYASVYITSVEEAEANPLESITITGNNSVAVGSTITLTASPNAGADLGEVTWTSSDTEVATVEGGVVTGVAEGTTKITATSGEIKSAEFEVAVTAASSTENQIVADYTTGWDGYTFSGSGKFTTSISNDDILLNVLNSEGEIASSATRLQEEGDNQYRLYTDSKAGGIKLGTSDNAGGFSFAAVRKARKIDFKVVCWGGKTAGLKVNDVEKTCSSKSDGTISSAEILSFEFSMPTDTISIMSIQERIAIVGITLYY